MLFLLFGNYCNQEHCAHGHYKLPVFMLLVLGYLCLRARDSSQWYNYIMYNVVRWYEIS